MKKLAWIAVLVGVGSLSVGCSSLKPQEAPFYVYGSSLLNTDVTPAYPREPSLQPAKLIQSIDDGDEILVRADEPEAPASAVQPTLVDPANADLVRAKSAPLQAEKMNFRPGAAAGYIGAVYGANGIALELGADDAIARLHATAKKQGTVYHATRPAVGDLVFFHNTYDRNGDGRNNDWYTHVGLVEGVEQDGTISVLSYLDGKVDSFAVNLEHPNLDVDERTGKVWNTPIRRQTKSDAPFTEHLSGELFAGFGNLLGDRTEFVVIDNWNPGMVVSGR